MKNAFMGLLVGVALVMVGFAQAAIVNTEVVNQKIKSVSAYLDSNGMNIVKVEFVGTTAINGCAVSTGATHFVTESSGGVFDANWLLRFQMLEAAAAQDLPVDMWTDSTQCHAIYGRPFYGVRVIHK